MNDGLGLYQLRILSLAYGVCRVLLQKPAPMTFCRAVKRRGQPGAVENPGNPPSSGASIGGVPRFMGELT